MNIDFSLDFLLDTTIKMRHGSVFVMAPQLKDVFFSTLDRVSQEQRIVALTVDDQDWREIHRQVVKEAEAGAIVVLVGVTTFPYRLAHIAYVFNKDDGLVLPDGGTRRGYGSPDFCLICWMAPQAWLSIDSHLRDSLIQVTTGGIRCYLKSTQRRDHISVLEEERWAASKDPIKALQQAGSLEKRHALLLELFPPNHRSGTFEDFDKPIIEIIEKLTDEGATAVQEDLLEIFALHNEFYLAGEALRREWPYREETLERLANGMAVAEGIGGQRQGFWNLMKELAERGQPRIRRLMEDLLAGGSRMASENVLYVLAEIRPWPEVVQEVVRLSEKSKDLAVLDLCRQIRRNAERLEGTKTSRSGLLKKIFSKQDETARVGGFAGDDYQHYYEVGLDMLTAKGKQHLEPQIQNLARFQARIQDLEVGSYPKSILTFERAVNNMLALSDTWFEAVEDNHLGSVSEHSEEYRLMKETMQEIKKGFD